MEGLANIKQEKLDAIEMKLKERPQTARPVKERRPPTGKLQDKVKRQEYLQTVLLNELVAKNEKKEESSKQREVQ